MGKRRSGGGLVGARKRVHISTLVPSQAGPAHGKILQTAILGPQALQNHRVASKELMQRAIGGKFVCFL